MLNDFNFIAPFYDLLAKLVFGRSIMESQTYFLSEIQESDTVLILGGGTGKLLEVMPKCKEIHFLDLSLKMISIAKKRDSESSINFIRTDFLTHDFASRYDVIICPFFLDCFDKNGLSKAIIKSRKLLKATGRLVVTDFSHEANPILLKLTYLFFRVTANLESSKLLNIGKMISDSGFEQIQIKIFKKGIFTSIYRKG